MRVLLRFITGALLGIGLVGLVLLNVFLVWIATGPRPIDRLVPYIEHEMSLAAENYKIDIGNAYVLWDGWRNPVSVKLRDMDIHTLDGKLLAEFKDVEMGLDIPALLTGHVEPNGLRLQKPYINFSKHADGSVTFGIPSAGSAEEKEELPLQSWDALRQQLSKNRLLYGLDSLTIDNAEISVTDDTKGVIGSAQKVKLHISRKWSAYNAEFSASLPFERGNAALAGSAMLPLDSGAPVVKLSFNNIMPTAFYGIIAAPWLQGAQLPLDGWINATLDISGMPAQAQFMLRAGEGKIQTEYLEGDLGVKTALLEGRIKNPSELTLTKIYADLNDATLEATGVLSKTEAGLGITLDGNLRNVPMEKIKHLWPKTLSPLSREWVLTNISGGKIPEAHLELRVRPGELEQERLRDDAIQAGINFTGALLKYKPEHPPVRDLNGAIRINANALTVSVKSGNYLNATSLESADASIADLNADNPRIAVDFRANGTASDAAEFLSFPDMQHAQRLHIRPEMVKGSVKAEVKLAFSFFAPRDSKGRIIEDEMVDYHVSAQTKDVEIPGFMEKFDIAAADGALEVDNKAVRYDGKASVNAIALTGNVIAHYKADENGIDTFIDASGEVPMARLKEHGYPQDFILSSGSAQLKTELKFGQDVEVIHAQLDLGGAAMTIPDLKWRKNPGEPASATIQAERRNGTTYISALSFKSADTDVEASMHLGPGNHIISASTKKFRLGRSNAAIEYVSQEGGHKIHAEGNTLDISPLMQGRKNSGFSFEDMPVIEAQVKLGTLVIGDDREIRDIEGSVKCLSNYCPEVSLTGKAGGENAPFNYRITKTTTGRKLDVKAENAGAFLYAFDLFDGIKGGEMNVQGVYDDTRPSRPLRGKLTIGEHHIKEVPLLAKLLTVASLSGFVDTLQGNGIRFVKLTVPFTLEHNVINLKEARSYGPAVGLTADGAITFPGKKLALSGTIIPSYTLNSFFGKVPVLGEVLTGGEGQGIIAARYSIEGTPENAEVSVNPLSVLTPGFLRGVFDVF